VAEKSSEITEKQRRRYEYLKVKKCIVDVGKDVLLYLIVYPLDPKYKYPEGSGQEEMILFAKSFFRILDVLDDMDKLKKFYTEGSEQAVKTRNFSENLGRALFDLIPNESEFDRMRANYK